MASQELPSSVPTMKLKVLSNAEEIGNHVFDNIPVDRTVGWIKQHLQNTLPSHPPADVQRILYQARFLDNDNATLAQIFGEPVPEEQAFHLVLKAPRASRSNAASSEPRTASAPPDPSRTAAPGPGQPDTRQTRTQAPSPNLNPPHIELNIGNIGQQIQQALDQVQAQMHQAGFTHIQIPRVGLAVQRATQAEIDGALRDAGLQGTPPAGGTAPTAQSAGNRPSVTVSQHPSLQTVPQLQHGPQAPHPQPTIYPPNVRITQTLTGTGLPISQPPIGANHFSPQGAQAHHQHTQAHQRAVELAAQQSQQQMQMLIQMRNAQGHPAFHQQPAQQHRADTNNNDDIQAQHLRGHQPHVRPFPGQALPAQAGPFPAGVIPGGVAVQAGPTIPGQAVPGEMLQGLPIHQAFEPPPFGPYQARFPRPGPHTRGGPPVSADQHRAATPSQADTSPPHTTDNNSSNFADRMQQIQRELEQVTRRTQELSTQRLSALGQMPSSVQQSELRDGFRTMAESLRRMQATLDGLASDPSVANQPSFVPLRTLVQDWLLQVQAVEADTPRWLGQQDSGNVGLASATPATGHPFPGLQSTVAAAFPPTAIPATAGNNPTNPVEGTSNNVMLVRDPSGQPHALLVGPSGTYRTPDVSQDIVDRLFSQAQRPAALNRNDSFSRFMRRAVGLPEGRRQPGQVPPPELRQALVDRLRAAGAQANQDAQLGQQQNAQAQNGNARNPRDNEAARDFIRAFLNPLWLIIRIAGMMYLFGGVGNGLSSWFQWRPLGIALLMLAAYLAQQPWMRRRVDAVRVHFEQLFGVPLNRDGTAAARQPNQPQGQGQAAAPDQAAAARAAQAIARVEQPGRPAQVTLRERFRSVERAVALFAASLVPGMGEGIVQARQIADMEARTAAEAAAAQQRELEAAAADAAAAAEQGTDGGGETGKEHNGVAESVAAAATTDATAGSSSQVDLASGNEDGSTLNRVNKGKERASDDGQDSQS